MRHRPCLPVLLALVTALLGAAHAPNAPAQDLLRAEVAAQPMIYANVGAARGCGLRLFAAQVANNHWIVAVEASLDVYSDETAEFQGEVSEFALPIRTPHGRNPHPVPVAIESIWVKAPDMGATTPVLDKVLKGQDGHSLRYAINGDSAVAVMLAAIKGESILFGFRRTANTADLIYVGTPELAPNESERLQRCIADLAK
jgi:hypothetical protein